MNLTAADYPSRVRTTLIGDVHIARREERPTYDRTFWVPCLGLLRPDTYEQTDDDMSVTCTLCLGWLKEMNW